MRVLDPPDDPSPEDEEAEYQAWKERVLQRQEENRRRWASRDGLIRLDERPQDDARRGLNRSLPTFRDAQRLLDLVIERLGERAELDVWAASGERCLLLRDPGRPGWLLPQRFIYLRALPPSQTEPQVPPMQFHGAERLMEFGKRLHEELLAERPTRQPDPPILSPGGQPGVIQIFEGESHYDITYGPEGAFKECCSTTGDTFAFAHSDELPFTIDPYARPAQVPPISLLLRPELEPDGVNLDTLADLVVEMRPLDRHLGRVLVPCPQPGTVQGTWTRGLWALRRAEWEGRLPEGPGWLVIDGWNGTAIATGPTFEAAVAAWQQEVERLQPLPPVDRPAPEQPKAATPPESADEDDHPASDEVTKLPPPLPDNVAVGSTGTIEFRIVPPVKMDWPKPRPENVAAMALFVPESPAVPHGLAEHGFHRVLRLFGEHGEVAFTFLRTEDDGITAVGDEAAPAVDPATLTADIDALFAKEKEERRDFAALGFPRSGRHYPVEVIHCLAWDELGRTPELRATGTSQQAEFRPRSWQIANRYQVIRIWMPDPGPAENGERPGGEHGREDR